MTFFAELGAAIAVDLTVDLIKSTAGAVRRRLSKGETEKALQTAIAAGLEEALSSSLDLDPLHRNEYESLFEQFFRREAVVDELALLLDPRPGVELSLEALTKEFNAAGFDATLIRPSWRAFSALESRPSLPSGMSFWSCSKLRVGPRVPVPLSRFSMGRTARPTTCSIASSKLWRIAAAWRPIRRSSSRLPS